MVIKQSNTISGFDSGLAEIDMQAIGAIDSEVDLADVNYLDSKNGVSSTAPQPGRRPAPAQRDLRHVR